MLPTVVPATSEHLVELLRLRREAEDWLAERGIDQWRRGEVRLEHVRAQLTAGDWHVLPGEGSALAGALRLVWSDVEIWGDDAQEAGYVHGLVIDRRCAGRGLGRALLDWAAGQVAARGRRVLRLDSAESNEVLRGYYASQGFCEVGRLDLVDRPWLNAVLWERLAI